MPIACCVSGHQYHTLILPTPRPRLANDNPPLLLPFGTSRHVPLGGMFNVVPVYLIYFLPKPSLGSRESVDSVWMCDSALMGLSTCHTSNEHRKETTETSTESESITRGFATRFLQMDPHPAVGESRTSPGANHLVTHKRSFWSLPSL